MIEALVREILEYLGCSSQPPTLRNLNRLIHAYIRRVPWESVSRINKRQTTFETHSCPRLPDEFWLDAFQYGFGGTCYESSLAFFSLLMSLGYKGYLTVNDMGETVGCHAALIILFDGQKYLVDVTIPVHAAVKIHPHKATRRRTLFHDYKICPVRQDVYEVMRSHHPSKNAFTLIDVPVHLTDYRMILDEDYTERGRFLNSVVMVKVIDGKVWRFFSDRKPYQLESFNRDGKSETILPTMNIPRTLADLFKMPEDKISAALAWVEGMERAESDRLEFSPAPVEMSIYEPADA